MSQSRRLVLVFCVLLIGGMVVVGGSVGSVTAQEDDIPSLPALYYGELSVDDGTLDGPVRVDVVADDEIQDSITTDADGSIGGSTIADDKLEVQEPDDSDVEFHVGGEPVTILSHEGEPVNDQSITWQEATQEIELQLDSIENVETSVDVSITETNSPVEVDDELTVTAEINNNGAIETTSEVQLETEDGDTVDTTDVTVGIDETETTTLSWTPGTSDAGNQSITVTANGETDSTDIEVEAPDIAEPDPDGSGDGGAGAPAPAPAEPDDDDTDDTEEPEPAFENTETQSIVASDDFGISQVRFTEDTSLASITWQTPAIPEEPVTVETYDHSPEGVPTVPGEVLTVSDVSMPADAASEPATIEFRADQAAIDDAGVSSEELTIARLADDSWEPLETTVIEETNDTVMLEAETPSFSNFAVTTTTPTAAIDSPDSATAGDEVTFEGGNSTTPFGEIVSYDWTIDDDAHTGERVTTTAGEDEMTVELTVENDDGATDTTTTTVTTTTDDEAPGFGVLAAVGALLAVMLLLRRRR